jgi:hypothetical protein
MIVTVHSAITPRRGYSDSGGSLAFGGGASAATALFSLTLETSSFHASL